MCFNLSESRPVTFSKQLERRIQIRVLSFIHECFPFSQSNICRENNMKQSYSQALFIKHFLLKKLELRIL